MKMFYIQFCKFDSNVLAVIAAHAVCKSCVKLLWGLECGLSETGGDDEDAPSAILSMIMIKMESLAVIVILMKMNGSGIVPCLW